MIQGEILQNSWSGFGGTQDRFDSIPPPRLLMIGIYIEEYPREQLQTMTGIPLGFHTGSELVILTKTWSGMNSDFTVCSQTLYSCQM
jgi:hypothetical protein